MKHSKILAFGVIAATAIGCANMRGNKTETADTTPVSTSEAKVAAERGDHVVSTIKFDRGMSGLSADAKAELDKAIADARMNGEIDDVTVVVWSDAEYPGKAKKLSKDQAKLADKRGDMIEDYLSKDLNISSYRVGVHNMAEKPNFLSEFFNTADADLKDELAAKGIAPTAGTATAGHASSALVFIKTK